jgi:peptidoglycan L-alanyl-D-glutamate endopeptidase CwlK
MSRDKTKLHPELLQIAQEFEKRCKAAGLNVLITETYRTKQEQDALYAKGRTAPGNIVTNAKYPKSPHCWGVAFDFCRNVRGCEYDDSDGFFRKCGEIGKSLGLAWGGDFRSFVDKPHLELKKYLPNNSVNELIRQYGTPEKFIASWSKTNEEDDKMTYEKWKEFYERYMNELAKEPVPDWAKAELEEAKAMGITDGTRPMQLIPRYQASIMAKRAAEK